MEARHSEKPFAEAFLSPLGWIALVGCGRRLQRLSFGHATREQALGAVGLRADGQVSTRWSRALVRRIGDYAAGRPDDLRDVEVDWQTRSAFQRSVYEACRAIPYGQTRSYGQLAREVGAVGAARAVGNCMAANRIPLVVPCHRVVPASGRLGRFSAPGGVAMKRRLLKMESR